MVSDVLNQAGMSLSGSAGFMIIAAGVDSIIASGGMIGAAAGAQAANASNATNNPLDNMLRFNMFVLLK